LSIFWRIKKITYQSEIGKFAKNNGQIGPANQTGPILLEPQEVMPSNKVLQSEFGYH